MKWVMILGLFAVAASAAEQPQAIFERRCTGCHAVDEHRIGPKLRGVFGRKAGSLEGFPYSEALKKPNVVWTAETLDRWLANPDQFAPGNDMSFPVLNAAERAAIIEFLRHLAEAVHPN